MKKKQLLGIIVTGLVIFVVGVTGIIGNVINAKVAENTKSTGFWESLMSMSNEVALPMEDFIGVVNVVGEIGPTTTDMWSTASGYNHNQTLDYIDQMMYAENNKGILLYIDSPGGTVYESDELYLKLMEYKEVTGRPIWAYFAAEACSGGYYVAMAADQIYGNRNGWTGSIGVIISLLNCKGLYDKLGITEIDITSGKNKAMGSAGLDLTQEQYDIMQSLVDEAYDQFVGIVCEGRGMDDATVRQLADGRIYSTLQAKEVNLIDEVGSYEECVNAFYTEAKIADDVILHTPESAMSLMGSLYGMVESLKPQSDTELATDIMENNGNGVLKYYAK